MAGTWRAVASAAVHFTRRRHPGEALSASGGFAVPAAFDHDEEETMTA
jgi:hypothetical protein